MDRLLATWSGQVAAAGRSRSPQPTTHRKSSGQKRHQYCRNGRNRQDQQAGGDQWSDPVVDPQYRKLREDNNNAAQPAVLPQKISANYRQHDGYRIPNLPISAAVPRFFDPGPFANELPIQSTDRQQGEHYSNASAHQLMVSYSYADSNVASTALAIANPNRSFAFPTVARPANVIPGRVPGRAHRSRRSAPPHIARECELSELWPPAYPPNPGTSGGIAALRHRSTGTATDAVTAPSLRSTRWISVAPCCTVPPIVARVRTQ